MKKIRLRTVAGLTLIGLAPIVTTTCKARDTNHVHTNSAGQKIKNAEIKNSRIDLKMIAASGLPQLPFNQDDRDTCGVAIEPETEAGKKIASLGWKVTTEQKIGTYQAVAFAGKIQREMFYCLTSDGYVGIYAGSTLIGLVHGVPESKSTIVSVIPMESGGLRIWGKQVLNEPLADLVLQDDDTLHLEPLAAKETFCQGKAIVPNIYFQPIHKARKKLIAANWKPIKIVNNRNLFEWRKKNFSRKGIIEAKDCSGTELDYCWFEYISAEGILSVTTTGENAMPEVAEYTVTCGSPQNISQPLSGN